MEMFKVKKTNIMSIIKVNDYLKKITLNYLEKFNVPFNVAADSISNKVALQEMDEIASIKIQMRNDSEWFAAIIKKSISRGTTVEEALQYDAEWVSNQNKKY